MDGLGLIIGKDGEFPLYLHTKTSYKGHHMSSTEYQRIYLLTSNGCSVKFTSGLVPKFRMCEASSLHTPYCLHGIHALNKNYSQSLRRYFMKLCVTPKDKESEILTAECSLLPLQTKHTVTINTTCHKNKTLNFEGYLYNPLSVLYYSSAVP
jgi:hypothetical protein